VQGAGAVVSGLILGAVAFVLPNTTGGSGGAPKPGTPSGNAVPASAPTPAPRSNRFPEGRRGVSVGELLGHSDTHWRVRRNVRSPASLTVSKIPAGDLSADTLRGLLPMPRAPVQGARRGQPQP
jgi:hypothetical protein